MRHKIPTAFGGVIVSVLVSSVVDLGFGSRSGQTKDYTIGTCVFSLKHIPFKGKRKISESGKYVRVEQLGLLVKYKADITISLNAACYRHSKQHSVFGNIIEVFYLLGS